MRVSRFLAASRHFNASNTLRSTISGPRYYASKQPSGFSQPQPGQGLQAAANAPVPFFWRLVAVGTTFVAFYYTWRPLDDPKKDPRNPPDLGPRQFTRCTVLSVKADPPEAGNKADHVVIQMNVPVRFLPEDGSYLANAIHHIYIKDDDMQIERPYTPLNGIGVDGKMDFWIKKYPGGEVSNWLSRLPRHRNIEVRGPVQQWDWRSGDWDEIIMIGGGTGITAFTQLLHQAFFSSQPVVSAAGSKTHFTLLHSHRSPSQLPPKIITEDFNLYLTNDSDRFTEKVFVDKLDTEADDAPANVSVGRIDKKTLEDVLLERGVLIDSSKGSLTSFMSKKPSVKHLNPEKSVMVLVCGPEGMITAMAGPRKPKESEPAVGGILGELGFQTSQIRRL